MQRYSPALISMVAKTNHGERGYISGPALDPQRCVFQPYGGQAFTPLVRNLTFETVSIQRANRLATDAERAHAWTTLMASTAKTTDDAVTHATTVLGDLVAHRLNHAQELVSESDDAL